VRRDRLGGLLHEYAQVAWGDRISGTHTVGGAVDRDAGRWFAFVLLACAVVCFNRL
jgi:hypothetical protein